MIYATSDPNFDSLEKSLDPITENELELLEASYEERKPIEFREKKIRVDRLTRHIKQHDDDLYIYFEGEMMG